MSTFVSVGNATQPFRRLLDAVAKLAPQLPPPVVIQYGAAAGFTAAGCTCIDYLDMETFAAHMADADVTILHAGAGSVIHAVRAGKVPVVVPRRVALGEHVDDHQREFARELAQLGRIVSCDDVAQLDTAVARAVQLQRTLGSAPLPQPALVNEMQRLLREHAAACGQGV
ncbi:MAG TPA: glycosyltransferase [Candidatus Acidoferrum sp.]|nr:glycosyltransferase [Candidatus Acidoferrum sp.]